jgi:hypothetical protein
MTNLLPQSDQMILKKEYKYRKLVVIFLFFVGTVLISVGFLLPSLILSNIKLNIISDAAEKARISNENQTNSNTSNILLKDTKEKLALLSIKDSGPTFVSVVDLITKNKSANIKIKEISYEKNTDSNSKITISGLSKNRESLTNFLGQMQSVSVFKSVDLPVSNFAKDKDITFSMQILGSF